MNLLVYDQLALKSAGLSSGCDIRYYITCLLHTVTVNMDAHM